MRKVFVALFLTLLILSSCSKKIDFAEEGEFVEMRLGSASQEYYLDHYPEIITVSNDGIVRVFTEDTYTRDGELNIYVGEEPPALEIDITDEEAEEIKEVITENDFFSLDTDLTDYDVMDGSSTYITVYTENDEREVGGENPDNEKFSNIRKAIFKHVSDDYDDWNEEVREYIYEANDE